MQDGGLPHLESSTSGYVTALLNSGLQSPSYEDYVQNLGDSLYRHLPLQVLLVLLARLHSRGVRGEQSQGPGSCASSLCLSFPALPESPSLHSPPLDSDVTAFFFFLAALQHVGS